MALLAEGLSKRELPMGYRRAFTQTPEGLYWHLWRGQERVNGGLSQDMEWGKAESCRAAWNHYYTIMDTDWLDRLKRARAERYEFIQRERTAWDEPAAVIHDVHLDR